MNITKTTFGQTQDNQTVSLYRMENASGAYMTVTDLGCRVVEVYVPDKNEELRDVVLG